MMYMMCVVMLFPFFFINPLWSIDHPFPFWISALVFIVLAFLQHRAARKFRPAEMSRPPVPENRDQRL
jgi:hypothetical protein